MSKFILYKKLCIQALGALAKRRKDTGEGGDNYYDAARANSSSSFGAI